MAMSMMYPATEGKDSVVRELRGMKEHRQMDAARRRAMQEHPAGGARKLRVLVKLDTEQASALIRVEGTLTQANLHALYSITARTNALLPGLEITIDLSAARAVDEALQELIGVARRATLPEAAVREHAACRLRVLEPHAA